MIERETFVHLDLVLTAIMQNSAPFDRVSLLRFFTTSAC